MGGYLVCLCVAQWWTGGLSRVYPTCHLMTAEIGSTPLWPWCGLRGIGNGWMDALYYDIPELLQVMLIILWKYFITLCQGVAPPLLYIKWEMSMGLYIKGVEQPSTMLCSKQQVCFWCHQYSWKTSWAIDLNTVIYGLFYVFILCVMDLSRGYKSKKTKRYSFRRVYVWCVNEEKCKIGFTRIISSEFVQVFMYWEPAGSGCSFFSLERKGFFRFYCYPLVCICFFSTIWSLNWKSEGK